MSSTDAISLADTWGMHGDDIGIGWWIVMTIGMVLFWGAIIAGVVWLIRGSVGGWHRPRRESPSDILERRFAEGGLSVEDYRERRDVLAHGRPSGAPPEGTNGTSDRSVKTSRSPTSLPS